ncbi:MAG: hypothetical protein ABL904_09435 [Hyphomicrobiaceae bacterium]
MITLASLIRDGKLLWVYCNDCGPERDVDPASLELTGNTPVPGLGRRHIKCSTCGSRKIDTKPELYPAGIEAAPESDGLPHDWHRKGARVAPSLAAQNINSCGKKMKQIGAITVAIFLVLSGAPAKSQSPYQVTKESFACRSRGDYEKFIELIVAKDEVAVDKFMSATLAVRRCVALKPGTVVHVETMDYWKGLASFRPQGELDVYWTDRTAAERKK